MRQALAEQPGTYFLTDFLARSFPRTVWRGLGLDRHPELRDDYFRNYTRVVWLAQRPTPALRRDAAAGGGMLGLPLETVGSARRAGAGARAAGRGSGSVNVRAALLPAAGTALRVVDLELAEPGPGEVLVRLAASGVCSDDLNVLDGTVEVPCPVVPGHEGAGVVERLGEGVSTLQPGDHVALSWAPYCGRCEQCLRDLPHLCGTAWPLMLAGGMLDGTTRLEFGGATVHHYCFLSSFAERAVVPGPLLRAGSRRRPAGGGGAARLRGHERRRRGLATAGVRPGERVAVLGLGGTGLSAVLGARAAGAGW